MLAHPGHEIASDRRFKSSGAGKEAPESGSQPSGVCPRQIPGSASRCIGIWRAGPTRRMHVTRRVASAVPDARRALRFIAAGVVTWRRAEERRTPVRETGTARRSTVCAVRPLHFQGLPPRTLDDRAPLLAACRWFQIARSSMSSHGDLTCRPPPWRRRVTPWLFAAS